MELTKYEMETIYNYNQEEPLASCYTMDRALIRRLDALAEKHKEITLIRKELSDEQCEKMAMRARERFGFVKEGKTP